MFINILMHEKPIALIIKAIFLAVNETEGVYRLVMKREHAE